MYSQVGFEWTSDNSSEDRHAFALKKSSCWRRDSEIVRFINSRAASKACLVRAKWGSAKAAEKLYTGVRDYFQDAGAKGRVVHTLERSLWLISCHRTW